MWSRRQAAEYLGLNVDTFDNYVASGQAPAPAGTRGQRRLWDPADIREYARHRTQNVHPSRPIDRPVTGAPDPDVPLWTGRQCADYHGISLRAWKAAVARGAAPERVGCSGKNTPVWDPASVRSAIVED
jgi:predicted DNA-binding transcriptional regulator AlpA